MDAIEKTLQVQKSQITQAMQELELKVIGTDDVRKSLEKRVNDSLVEVLSFVQNSQKTLATHTKQYVEMKDWQI